MSKIWILTKREFASFFDSLIAYILIVIFLAVTGFFTWISDANVFYQGQANLQIFFAWSYWTLFFFIPAITMRTIAEEKRSGTLELLVTKDVSDMQVLLGKFLASLMLVGIALVCTLPFYFTLMGLGDVDHGAVIFGYLGLLLLSSAYIGIGMFASSLSDNQIVGFLLGLFIAFFFHFLFGLIGGGMSGWFGRFFDYLGVERHFDSISRGLIDTRDVLYLLSVAAGGLLLARTMLARRNWVGGNRELKNWGLQRAGLLLGIIVLLNVVASSVWFRLDFTADQRYTLSGATKDVLKDLEEPVTVRVFFSAGLQPQLDQVRTELQDLLKEYESRSSANVVYEFVDPNENEEAESKAQQAGIPALMVNVRERDQASQKRAYMGIVFEMGDNKGLIPVVSQEASLEYALTREIKKVSVVDKPRVGFLTGHGEPSMRASAEVLQALQVLYEVDEYTLSETEDIPSSYKTIAIIDPRDSFPPSHLAKLDKYLAGGGSLYMAFSLVEGDLQGMMLKEGNSNGLDQWLAYKGLQVNKDFVKDAKSASITVQQQMGFFMMNNQIPFPYFPLASSFADHPVTKGLEGVILPFVSSITCKRDDPNIKFTNLMMSSGKSGIQWPPYTLNFQGNQFVEGNYDMQKIPLAVAAEGRLAGEAQSRMVVVSNGRFAVNGEGQNVQRINADNVNFAVNSIDWLSDDTGLIGLRTKGVTRRPLNVIEDGTRLMLKYGNVSVPIVLVLLYGFVRARRNQAKRARWKRETY